MTFTIVLYLVICLLLVIFSLLQQNQSGGMGVLGGSSDTLLGTGQVSFLSKLVSFLAVLYFVGSFFLNVISSSENPVLIPGTLIEKEKTEEKPNSDVSDALSEIVSNLPSTSPGELLETAKPGQNSTTDENLPTPDIQFQDSSPPQPTNQ